MRIALVADLHGNWPATQAMEKALSRRSADEIWFLGDAVGKGPENAFTCDWVMRNCTRCVGGNWDYGIGGKEYEADEYYWNQLGEERMAWLRSLPPEMEAELSGIAFRLFHGRPVTELMQVQDDKAKLGAAFRTAEKTYGGVIFADSHRPFIRTLAEGYIVNCGSVGNSLGVPRAHALLLDATPGLDAAELEMTILSVPYDNQAAVRAALASEGHPFTDAYVTEITTGVYSR